jgi:hypothetical protein
MRLGVYGQGRQSRCVRGGGQSEVVGAALLACICQRNHGTNGVLCLLVLDWGVGGAYSSRSLSLCDVQAWSTTADTELFDEALVPIYILLFRQHLGGPDRLAYIRVLVFPGSWCIYWLKASEQSSFSGWLTYHSRYMHRD